MNITALAIGIVLACLIVFRFKQTGYENKSWPYAALLASFPVYYWCFALYSNQDGALFNEGIVGLVFIVAAGLAYRVSKPTSLVVLAIGFIGHGVYDVIHPMIYAHSVAPVWWPEFCGSIDMLLGVYVMYLAVLRTHQPGIAKQIR